MRKLIFKNVVRSIVYGVCLVLAGTGCSLLINMGNNQMFVLGLVMFVPLMLVTAVLFASCRLHPKIENLEKLDNVYPDVKNPDRTRILFSFAAQLACFVFSCIMCFSNISAYDTKYPNAKDYLTTHIGADTSTICFFESLPTWISEVTFADAQCVNDVTKLLEAGNSMESDEVTSTLDKLDDTKRKVNVERVIALMFLLLFGWFYNYSSRMQQYISIRKELVNK